MTNLPFPPASRHSSPPVFGRLRHLGAIVTFFGALLTSAGDVVVVINELDVDQPGSDAAEFVELFAYDSSTLLPAPSFPLDEYVVVFFNGASPIDAAYAVTPVNGAATAALTLTGKATDASGLFVIGSPGVAGAGIELTRGSAGWLQNGPDAVALYKNPKVVFTTATGATAFDRVDAVVYGTDDPDDVSLLEVLTPGRIQVNEPANGAMALARIPDGGAAIDPDAFQLRPPTPGFLNQPANALALSLPSPALVEGTALTATLSRTGPTAGAVTAMLTASDGSELIVPRFVEFPAGVSSIQFILTAEDDLWPDGAQSATISVAAPGYLSAEAIVSVSDDDTVEQPVVINEVYATGWGDANGDGVAGDGDEFVEILNRSGGDFDLSGFSLFESIESSPRHVFPEGTVVSPGCAVVVFGGGLPMANGSSALGITPAFGSSWIQVASAPANGLALAETGDRLSLRNPTGQEVAGMSYDSQSGAVDSITRDPDGTGPFASHSATASAMPFSPGTQSDGTPFFAITRALAASIAPTQVAENAGPAAATLTVSRPAPFADALVVTISSSDPGEATPAALTVIIPAGEASATVPIDAVDDWASDGVQRVAFTCIGAGALNATVSLDVLDDGSDVPAAAVFINEVDADQPGGDTGEFIELSIGEAAIRGLDGYIVVLFNGGHASNGAYAVIDLSGQATNPRGIFVIGAASVPGVNLIIPGNSIQNGADAVAVYRAAPSDFPLSPATGPSPIALVDALVYDTGEPIDADLLAAFADPGGVAGPFLKQYSEGADNNAKALARVPDATSPFGVWVAQAPTPGASNLSPAVAGYDLWASAPVHAGIGSPESDPDGDGLTNALEYALGSDPKSPGLPYAVSLNSARKPRLSIPKGAIAAADPTLTWTVEASSTLIDGSWSPANTTVVSNTPSQLVVDYSGPASTAFLRLAVTRRQ